MARTKNQTIDEKPVRINTCNMCGKPKRVSEFYKSSKEEFKQNGGVYTYCKVCLKKMCVNDNNVFDVNKFIEMLKMIDRPFIRSLYETALKGKREIVGAYMSLINMNDKVDMGWKDSDEEVLDLNDKNNIKMGIQKHETCIVDGDNFNQDSLLNIKLTNTDINTQNEVIRLLGYAPFDGYSDYDKKFLYGELLPYLDENTVEDQYKVSVLIQILNNDNQIRKIDLVINKLSLDEKQLLQNNDKIKNLTAIKSQIGQVTDKLAKENGIALKHRGDKKSGESTLTSLMKKYRENGFEDAEEDYFNQKKAKGIKIVADISNRSILEQLQLDENDMNDMLFNQRNLIQQLEAKVTDLEEENRQLYVEINELKKEITN